MGFMSNPERVLTLRAVANRLNVTTIHVARLTRNGTMPCVETPLGRLYFVEDVDEFADEQRRRARRDGRVRVPLAGDERWTA